MRNKKWKAFSKLSEKCYSNMIGAEKDGSCWKQAFELLKEIVLEERKENPGFAPQIEDLDEATEYEYDVQGWLEDCLDETDMRKDEESLLRMCDDLLNMFAWPGYTGSDLKFRKAMALGDLGREKDSVKYCEEWIQKEPDNILAATAAVYAFIRTKEFASAEKLVDWFIIDKSECTDENDVMFTAASKLYEAMGKKKEKKQIDKAMKAYDDYLKEYFENMNFDFDGDEFDEIDMDYLEDEWPFG